MLLNDVIISTTDEDNTFLNIAERKNKQKINKNSQECKYIKEGDFFEFSVAATFVALYHHIRQVRPGRKKNMV